MYCGASFLRLNPLSILGAMVLCCLPWSAAIATTDPIGVELRYYGDGKLDCGHRTEALALPLERWLDGPAQSQQPPPDNGALWIRIERPAHQEAQWLIARNIVDGALFVYDDTGSAQTTWSSQRVTPEDVPGLRTLPLGITGANPTTTLACLVSPFASPDVLAVVNLRTLRGEEFWNIALLSLSAGISWMMAALALGYFVALRERIFLYYVIYVLALQVYLWHSLRAVALLMPESLKSEQVGNAIGLAGIALLLLSASRFAVEFTGVASERPRISNFVLGLSQAGAVCALVMLALQLDPALVGYRIQVNLALNAFSLVSICCMLLLAALAVFRGNRLALVYLIGWTPLLLIIATYCIHFLGLTGNQGTFPISPTMLAAASAFESTVLGLALVERARTAQRERDEARHAALHDPLTGVLNRAGLDQALHAVGEPSGSVLYLDLDHFKRINDGHGHARGDRVLADFARLVSEQLRRVDLLARHGGEEFIALLPDVSLGEARGIAERIGALVANGNPGGLPVTVSIGVAERHPGEAFEAWLERADAALYQAKNSGRARVCVVD